MKGLIIASVSLAKGPVNSSVTLCHFLSSPEMTVVVFVGVGELGAMIGAGTPAGANEGLRLGVDVGAVVPEACVGLLDGSFGKIAFVGTTDGAADVGPVDGLKLGSDVASVITGAKVFKDGSDVGPSVLNV
jgi:hypothetical protein